MAMSNMDERLLRAAMSGNVSELKDMVSENSEILLGTTPQGSTCLHISSIFGHAEFSETVVAQNHSLLSIINLYGETPLLVAVTSGHDSLAFALLKQYQELHLSELILKQDNNGDNALHHATRSGHGDLALKLLAAEPRLSEGVNMYNESPMYLAVSSDLSFVLERLLEIPYSSHVGPHQDNALHVAVRIGNPGIAKKILEARPSIAKEGNKWGNTPIQLAVLWDKLDMIRILLEHDRSLGYLTNTQSGELLLHNAAIRGHVAIAQEILNYCPDAPCFIPGRYSMLHCAVKEGHVEFVEFIMKAPQLQKVINMQDMNGDTALHIAVRKCNPKIVRALLAHKTRNLALINDNGEPVEWSLVKTTAGAKTLNWVCS